MAPRHSKVIDETHHLLREGSGRDAEGAIQTLKSLLQRDWSVAVIVAGVDRLRDGVLTDPETDRWFPRFWLSRIMEDSREARSLRLCAENIGLSSGNEAPPNGLPFGEHGQPEQAINLAKTTIVTTLEAGRTQVTLHDVHSSGAAGYGDMPTSPSADASWDALRTSLTDAGWAR